MAPGQLADTGTIATGLDDTIWSADFGNDRIQQFASDGTFLKMIASEHISKPTFLVVDSDGHIFVSNFGSNLVVVLDADGHEIAIIDGSESGGTSFGGPTGLSLDGHGNLYVASFSSDLVPANSEGVWKISLPADLRPTASPEQATPMASPAAKILLSPIGEITGGDDPLLGPEGLAFDDDGNLYIVDSRNERIVVVDPDGTVLRTWGEPGAGPGQFDFSESDYSVGFLAIHGDNVYVSDSRNNRIQQFTLDGVFVREWGSEGSDDGQFSEPSGIAIDEEGRVLVADYGNSRMQIFDSSGAFLESWGGSGNPRRLIVGPNSVTVGPDGDIYVSSETNNAVYRFDSNGNLLLEISAPRLFTQPWGIAIDESGRIFVIDEKQHQLQVFSTNGDLLAAAGVHGSGKGQFNFPMDIAIGPDGNIYVADTDNNRVQIFSIETPAS